MALKTLLKRTVQTLLRTVGWYRRLARSSSRIQRTVSLGIMGLSLFLGTLLVFQVLDPYPLKDWIYLKLTLNGMGISGVLTYILMVALLPLFSPLTLVVVTGSAAFGPFEGFLLSYIGCLINANIAYVLVKSLSIEDSWGNSRRGGRIKGAIARYGSVLVMSLQLVTVIPFTLINAAAAASGVEWKQFMKATCIGICPGLLLYSFMGNTLISNMVSPQVYFAAVFVMVLLLSIVALRKKAATRPL